MDFIFLIWEAVRQRNALIDPIYMQVDFAGAWRYIAAREARGDELLAVVPVRCWGL